MQNKCQLVLERDTFTKDTTLGKLYFNGEFLCHTLENSYEANNRNTSSIPCGLYDVRVRTAAESGNFKYVHLLVEEVPKRSYILFHIGNTHKDTHGCILTGLGRNGDEMITQSLKAHTLLMNVILNNNLQDEITLIVKNDLSSFDDNTIDVSPESVENINPKKSVMSIWNKLFSTGATKLVDSVGTVLDDMITSKEEKLAAELKIKELIARYEGDIERNITDRWQSDMNADSWLSKNVRPLMLVFLVVSTVVMVFVDSGSISFTVKPEWVDLLQIVLITVIGAYFGGRTLEKRNN